jgi:hypothetical protein
VNPIHTLFGESQIMIINLMFILILASTIVTGLLAGASLDKAIVQLPARHRMGVIGFATFSRANDLGNGLIAYPVLGISAALLTIIAAFVAFWQCTPFGYALPLYISALLAVLHSATTSRAAPNMLSLRQATSDEATLTETLDRFAKWHNVRTLLQLLNFITLVWAIVAYTMAMVLR